MLLKNLVYISLVVCFAFSTVIAEESKSEISNKNEASFCETQTAEQCVPKERTTRSINSPISNFIDSLKNKLVNEFSSIYNWASDSTEQKENFIQCSDRNLVIEIVSATVSNVDKTKCPSNRQLTNNADCTEKALSSLLASKMCNGRNKCLIRMEKEFSFACECSNNKYFDILYTCVKPTGTLIEKSIKDRTIKRENSSDKMRSKRNLEAVALRGGSRQIPERPERPDEREWQERLERPDRRELQERSERPDRRELQERSERPDRRELQERPEKNEGGPKVSSVRNSNAGRPEIKRQGRPQENRGLQVSSGNKRKYDDEKPKVSHGRKRNGHRNQFFNDYRFDSYFYPDYYFDYYYYGDYYYDPFYDYYYDYYYDPFLYGFGGFGGGLYY